MTAVSSIESESVPDDYEGLSSTFAAACRRADREHAQKYGPPVEPHDIPLVATNGVPSASQLQAEYERALTRLVRGAAAATVEALMFSLRQRRVAALSEPDTRRRLSELSEGQLAEVADRLQKLKPHIAQPWGDDEIAQLFVAWREIRC